MGHHTFGFLRRIADLGGQPQSGRIRGYNYVGRQRRKIRILARTDGLGAVMARWFETIRAHQSVSPPHGQHLMDEPVE